MTAGDPSAGPRRFTALGPPGPLRDPFRDAYPLRILMVR